MQHEKIGLYFVYLGFLRSFAVAYIFSIVAEVDCFAVASVAADIFKCGSCWYFLCSAYPRRCFCIVMFSCG